MSIDCRVPSTRYSSSRVSVTPAQQTNWSAAMQHKKHCSLQALLHMQNDFGRHLSGSLCMLQINLADQGQTHMCSLSSNQDCMSVSTVFEIIIFCTCCLCAMGSRLPEILSLGCCNIASTALQRDCFHGFTERLLDRDIASNSLQRDCLHMPDQPQCHDLGRRGSQHHGCPFCLCDTCVTYPT